MSDSPSLTSPSSLGPLPAMTKEQKSNTSKDQIGFGLCLCLSFSLSFPVFFFYLLNFSTTQKHTKIFRHVVTNLVMSLDSKRMMITRILAVNHLVCCFCLFFPNVHTKQIHIRRRSETQDNDWNSSSVDDMVTPYSKYGRLFRSSSPV